MEAAAARVIDTHAHLDACADPPEALVERARAAGVTRIVTSARARVAAAPRSRSPRRTSGVYAALGIHPHEAGGGEAARRRRARGAARPPEGGRRRRDRARPLPRLRPARRAAAALRALLELAEAHGKPAVIHTRAADAETAAVLAGFPGEVDPPLLLVAGAAPARARAALLRLVRGQRDLPEGAGAARGGGAGAGRPASSPRPTARTSRPSRAAAGRTSPPTSSTRSRRSPRRAARTPAELERRIDANARRRLRAAVSRRGRRSSSASTSSSTRTSSA